MRKKCGFNVGNDCNSSIVTSIFGGKNLYSFKSKFVPKVFAESGGANSGDDGTGGDDNGGSKPAINYEDLIAKARKEEKEKQYKNIERLKTQVDSLTQQHNDDLLVVADLKEKLKKAEDKLSTAGEGDSEEIKTLKKEVEDLKKDKEDLEKKVKDFEDKKPVNREEIEQEVRAELEEEYKVKTYKAEKLAEHKEDLLVPELVIGTTIEDIDASLQSALERSSEIRKTLGVDISQPQKKKGTPKGGNPSSSSVQGNKYTAEYLASLDVSSPEYAEVRKNLGLH